MAKTINVEFPRSAIQELIRDKEFSHNLYNAILHAENTGEDTPVKIGDARKRAVVSVIEG